MGANKRVHPLEVKHTGQHSRDSSLRRVSQLGALRGGRDRGRGWGAGVRWKECGPPGDWGLYEQ